MATSSSSDDDELDEILNTNFIAQLDDSADSDYEEVATSPSAAPSGRALRGRSSPSLERNEKKRGLKRKVTG